MEIAQILSSCKKKIYYYTNLFIESDKKKAFILSLIKLTKSLMEIKPHLYKSTHFVIGKSITYLFYNLKLPLSIKSYLRKSIIRLKFPLLCITERGIH